MVEVKILVTEKEADDIIKGNKMYLIRSEKVPANQGNYVRLQTVRDRKEVLHQVCRRRYLVTYVDTWSTAPVDDGTKIISLKEIA